MELNNVEEIINYLKNDDYCLLEDNYSYKLLKEDEIKILLNHINNLHSKIDKAIELKHNWQNIEENATMYLIIIV